MPLRDFVTEDKLLRPIMIDEMEKTVLSFLKMGEALVLPFVALPASSHSFVFTKGTAIIQRLWK